MMVRMTEASESLETTPAGRGLVIWLGNRRGHQTELPTKKASHEEGKSPGQFRRTGPARPGAVAAVIARREV